MKFNKKRIMYSIRDRSYLNLPEIRSHINRTTTTIEQSEAGIKSGAKKKLRSIEKSAKNKRRIGEAI
jgi:hypothetical protein